MSYKLSNKLRSISLAWCVPRWAISRSRWTISRSRWAISTPLSTHFCTKSAVEMKSLVLTYFSEPEWQLSTPPAWQRPANTTSITERHNSDSSMEHVSNPDTILEQNSLSLSLSLYTHLFTSHSIPLYMLLLLPLLLLLLLVDDQAYPRRSSQGGKQA